MPTTLITGASSGLGLSFARQMAKEGHDLVLVARDQAKLDAVATELAENHPVSVETISADLSQPEDLLLVENRLRDSKSPIDFLINNAGFGLKGKFLDSPADAHEEMVRVNVIAVLRLTHVALETMGARGEGDILNVSSVAGFTPALRPSSTYAATKAFVTALTEGLSSTAEELGVHISAVCPGWVKTEFHKRAGLDMSKMPDIMWLEAEDVVATALHDHRKGKVLSIPSAQYKVIATAARLAPRNLAHFVVRKVGRRAH